MLEWADSSLGVGESQGGDLAAYAEVPTLVAPQDKKTRHRPNRGRKKRTDRNPPLAEPPWDILRELNIYIPPGLSNLPYVPPNWRSGHIYIAWKKRVLAMWGTTCHLCGHPGAYTADHLIPVSQWNNQPYDAHLGRPAHGVDGCPTCKVKCNSSRGNKQLAMHIRDYKPPVAL